MKKHLRNLIFIISIIFACMLFFSNKVNAEGTRDMYDWNGSTVTGENDRWFFDDYSDDYVEEDDSYYDSAGIPNKTVIKVYAKKGEKIKFASSTSYAIMTAPSGRTTEITISNGIDTPGCIYSANQEKNKTYKYRVIDAKETGVYTFQLLVAVQPDTQTLTGINSSLVPRNINTGDSPFSEIQGDSYIAAWDIQIEDENGSDINGRVWMDWVSIYRGFLRAADSIESVPSKANVKFHILTHDGYTYTMNCNGMDPGGMNFFVGTRGIVDKRNNQSVYKSVTSSEIGGAAYTMPVPSNGESDIDHYGKVFFNVPSDDLPPEIYKKETNTIITEGLTFNENTERGKAGTYGTFSFSVSEPCTYVIKIKNKSTGEVVRVLSNAAVEGKNTIAWDGKNYTMMLPVDAGEYEADLEVRNGEYHFILNDVENVYEGIKITSDLDNNSTIYYNNDDISNTYAPKTATEVDSATNPYAFDNNYGDLKVINIWAYNSVKSDTDFFVMDSSSSNSAVIKGMIFYDTDNSGTYVVAKDKPMEGIKVNVKDSRGNIYSAVTTTNGQFYVNVPRYYTYTLEIDSDCKDTKLKYYTNTTNNERQSIYTQNETTDATPIGYYAEKDKVILYKEWVDNENNQGLRPDSVNVKIKIGESVIEETSIKANMDWKKTLELPVYDENNNLITYNIEENEINEYYNLANSNVQVDGNVYTITNVGGYIGDKVLVNVNKIWEDDDNSRGDRPDSISGYFDNGITDPVPFTISRATDWKKTFALDKYDENSVEYNWNLVENDVYGYTSLVQKDGDTFNITNTIRDDVINLKINKIWSDYDDEYYLRPESIFVKVKNGDSVVRRVEIKNTNNWETTVHGLDKYDEHGDEITYTIEEENVQYYTVTEITDIYDTQDSRTKAIDITNSLSDEYIQVKIKKIWDDKENEDNLRPSSVNVKIKNGNQIVREVTLTDTREWETIVTSLEKYDEHGEIINYTFTEDSVDNYGLESVTGPILLDNEHTYLVEMKNSLNNKNIIINKKWDDNDNADGTRPNAINIKLKSGDTVIREAQITSENGWKTIISNVPKFDDQGNLINYTIEEEGVPLYYNSETSSEYTVETNVDLVLPSESYKIDWEQRDDGTWQSCDKDMYMYPLSSEEFTVETGGVLSFDRSVSCQNMPNIIYAEYTVTNVETGEIVPGTGESTRITGISRGTTYEDLLFDHVNIGLQQGTYKIEFKYSNLIKYVDGLNKAYVKNLKFTETGETCGIDITNKLSDDIINIKVKKIWDDFDNKDNLRPESVTLKIKNGNEVVRELEVSAQNNWEGTATGLDKYDSNNEEINYTIEEDLVNHYVLTNSSNWTEINEGRTKVKELTNSINSINYQLTKSWEDYNNLDGVRPDKITVQIKNGNTVVREAEIKAEDDWKTIVTGLPRYDDNNNEINYTIDENRVEGYRLTKNEETGLLMDYTKEAESSAANNWAVNSDNVWETTVGTYSSGSLTMAPFTTTGETKLSFDMSVSCYNLSSYGLYYIVKNTETDEVIADTTDSKITGTTRGTTYETLQYDHVEVLIENAGTYQIVFYNKFGSSSGLNKAFVKNITYSTYGNTKCVNLENTERDDIINIKLDKEWDDYNNKDLTRPESILVDVKNGDTVVRTVEVTAADNWQTTVGGLPKFDENDNEINYTFSERAVESYELVRNEDLGYVADFALPITNSSATSWTKRDDGTWQTTNAANSTATLTMEEFSTDIPTTIDFDMSVSCYNLASYGVYYVVKNTQTNETVADTTNSKIYGTTRGTTYDSLQYDHISVPIESAGTYQIVFYFYRAGSSSGLNQGFIKNVTYKMARNTKQHNLSNKLNDIINIRIKKNWEDYNNKDLTRPDSVTVDVKNGNDTVKSVQLTEANGWQAIASGLPRLDNNDNEINYTIEEQNVEGYKQTGKIEYDVLDMEQNLNIAQMSNWKQNEDGTYQSTNTSSGTGTLTSEEFTIDKKTNLTFDWSVSCYNSTSYAYAQYTITNLNTNAVVSGTGASTKITGTTRGTSYNNLTFDSVEKELEPGRYIIKFEFYKRSSSYSSGLNAAFVKNLSYKVSSNTKAVEFTNEINTSNLVVEKIWSDYENKSNRRPSSIDVDIKNGDEVVRTVQVTAEDGWKKNVSGLPQFDNLGQPINYTVSEHAVEGYSLANVNYRDIADYPQAMDKSTTSNFSQKEDGTWESTNTSSGSTANLTMAPFTTTVPTKISFDMSVSCYNSSSAGVYYIVKNTATNQTVVDTTSKKINGIERGLTYDELQFEHVDINIDNPGTYQIIFYFYRYSTSTGGNYGLNKGFVKNITYDVASNSKLATLTNEDATVSMVVEKKWNDYDNKNGGRPNSVDVDIKNGDEVVRSVQVKAEENWQKTITGLPKFDNLGQTINYTVSEHAVEGYGLASVNYRDIADYPEAMNKSTTSNFSQKEDGTWESTITNSGTASLTMAPFTTTIPTKISFDMSVSCSVSSSYGLYYIVKNTATNQTIVDTTSQKINGIERGSTYDELQFEHVDINIDNPGTYQIIFYFYRYSTSTGGNYGLNKGFIKNITYDVVSNGRLATLTNEDKTLNVKIKKTWDDSDNSQNTRPESVTVELKNGSNTVQEVQLTAQENWEKTITGLDKFDSNNELITYTATEHGVENYILMSNENTGRAKDWERNIEISTNTLWQQKDDGTWESTNSTGQNATLVTEPITTTKPVTLNFDLSVSTANSSSYGLYYVVKNTATNQTVADTTSSKMYGTTRGTVYDELQYEHVNIDLANAGTYQITFYFTKNSNSGLGKGFVKNIKYFDEGSTDVIELTNKLNRKNIKVTKEWIDNNDAAGKRPSSVNVKLMSGNSVAAEHAITADDNWEYTFSVPEYNSNGEEIEYTVSEDEVEKYTLEGIESGANVEFSSTGNYAWTQNTDGIWVSGNYNVNSTDSTLTSTQFTIKETTTIGFDWAVSSENSFDILYYEVRNSSNSVVKGGNLATSRISGTGNGTVYESLTFNPVSFELEPGTYTLAFVYHKDSSGHTGLDHGYVKNISIGNNNGNGYTITNRYVPDDKINLTVVKAWDDNNNAAGKRPESIQVQLYADNVAQGEAVTITNSNWSTVFNNLPVYKENGDVIAYTVREVNSNNIYYSEKSNVLNTETNTITITNEFDVPGEKINLTVVKAWDDNNNAAGKRPSSIKVQLYANSVAQGNQVTITNSNWSTVFNNLAKYDENGDEISYTVSEVNSNSIFYSEKSNVLNTETNTVTITNEFAVPNDTINVTVRKVWDDNNDAASKRPQSLNVELSNGDDYDLSDDNEWSHTFTGLPKYDANGNVIAYTASENMSNADQRNYQLVDSVTSNDANGNITIELTNRFIPSQEKVQITVEKVWDDNSNSASKRPESLDISILNGNNIEDTYSYTSEDKLDTDSNTWSHTFELPKYDRYNNPINYVAEEDFESIFYTAEVGAIDANNKITITNTFSVPDDKINLTVVKAWDDNNNAAGKRPESIDVQLYANRTAVGNSITITNENWSTVFSNLPVYDENGNKFSYSVREVNSDSIYYSEKSNVLNAQTNTITITNEFAIPADTVSVKVVKVWDDNSNEAEKRPGSLEVELSNGNKYTLTDSDKTSDNVWEHTFTGLRKYNSTTGDEIVYTAVENFSDVNYAQESETNVVSGIKTITFTNTFTPLTEKVNVTVTKVWDDNDNEAGKRPTSVSVELKNGSAVVGQATLNASNGWSHEFENLPKYNSRNNEINYTAVENCDSIYYEESGNSKSNDVITITNEFVVPDDTVNVEAVKLWDDTNNRDNVRPSSIVLVLSDETGAEVDTHEVSGNTTSNEGWAYTFTGLAKYDRLGNEKSYTVDEQVVDNNYIKSINGRIITNTYKLNNPIVEDDEIKKTGPETITKSKELLNYKLEYKATVKDFVGKATVTIVDTLPYEINVQTSNLDGGVYDSDAKTITWVEEVENIDTYANGSKAISIVKNIAVEYVDLDVNESELRNVATANIKLDRTSVEESVEDDHTSSVGIYGKVIVHYIDVDTEESIADDTVLTGKPGQKYETTAKDIKFYVLDSSEGEIKGEFSEEVKHVYYKYRKLKFNLAVEEKITAIKVDDEFIDVGDGKFEKFTLKNRASNVRVFYAVTVKNTGDIPGSATVRASIPTEMKFASTSEGWVERDGTLLVDVEELDVGDSVVYQIALDWVAEEKSFEAITDIAQIIETRNEAGFEDEDEIDNESSAAHQIVYEEKEKTIAQTVGNIVRSIKTGDNVLVYISLVILSTIGIAICVARRK
ncbi:MAG: Cna B-type domain-containing protein [Clostridia bacterium]|nr:Cna B-type domain-containing protein [Clostridia bacterium]